MFIIRLLELQTSSCLWYKSWTDFTSTVRVGFKRQDVTFSSFLLSLISPTSHNLTPLFLYPEASVVQVAYLSMSHPCSKNFKAVLWQWLSSPFKIRPLPTSAAWKISSHHPCAPIPLHIYSPAPGLPSSILQKGFSPLYVLPWHPVLPPYSTHHTGF